MMPDGYQLYIVLPVRSCKDLDIARSDMIDDMDIRRLGYIPVVNNLSMGCLCNRPDNGT